VPANKREQTYLEQVKHPQRKRRALMPQPTCQSDPKTQFELKGYIQDYIERITNQWLLVAPKANPAMLEMFRDRDAYPLRDLLPWSGEFAGKYLTASTQVLRLTNDQGLKTWLHQFVDQLISFQDVDGYLGPWPMDYRLANSVPYLGEKGMLTWDTWGHYHIMMGLLMWHEVTQDPKALKAAACIADLICARYLGQAKPRLVDTGSTEMNLAPVHSLCLLYKKVQEPRYLEMAKQIVSEFAANGPEGPLAGDYLRQGLAGKEYFETPKPRWESLHPIMGLAELYWISGDPAYRQAFERIWWSITRYDRHNNGGFSSGEQACGNPFDLRPIESCCTIAWIALSVEMLKLSGSSIAADEIELSTLNSVVGMHSSSGRWATYNTPMDGQRWASAHQIVFQARAGSPELNCCSVNSPRGFGMISDWAVMRDAEGFRLNYYGPSRLTVPLGQDGTVEIIQETDYPVSGRIALTISPAVASEFTLKLRIPYWSQHTVVHLNDKLVEDVLPSQYLAIQRVWQPGDRIDLFLDMSLHFWPGERDCLGKTSIYRGPLLLAFDQRYNLHLSSQSQPSVQPGDPWKPTTIKLEIPELDARMTKEQPVEWPDWLAPRLLLEFTAIDGKKVRLCDFGSSGEGGSFYASWLPVANAPQPVDFSPQNPLRSIH
jgi:DUF1680 family protein